MDCIFCKIVKKEIPSSKVYEDDKVFAFLDISPVNKGHTLVVPKKHSADLTGMEDVAEVFTAVKRLASRIAEAVDADGFNIMMNNRQAAGQAVMHSHVHIVPRFKDDGLKHWPGKEYKEGEAGKILAKIKEKL